MSEEQEQKDSMANEGEGQPQSAPSVRIDGVKPGRTYSALHDANPSPTYYANSAAAGHSQHDIFIEFATAVAPAKLDESGTKIIVPIAARVIIPPHLVLPLVNLLMRELQQQQAEQKPLQQLHEVMLRHLQQVQQLLQSAENTPKQTDND